MPFLKGHRSARGLYRALAAAVVCAFVQVACPPPCRAGESVRMMEQSIKAGLLYNFLKYTEWPGTRPASADSRITVCIFGDDPFHGSLQPAADRTVNQRRIELRSVDDVEGVGGCDLLFVNAAEKDRWPALAKSLEGKSVLTVSDMGEFASSGGMIEFVEKNERIEVQINMAAVTAARLVVNDRLLNLAHVVPADHP